MLILSVRHGSHSLLEDIPANQLLKQPSDKRGSSRTSILAMDAASGAAANSAGVTSLTFLSVVCADSITATSSWNGDA